MQMDSWNSLFQEAVGMCGLPCNIARNMFVLGVEWKIELDMRFYFMGVL